MRRRLVAVPLAVVALAGLSVTLRYDLAQQAWRRGHQRLAAGDTAAALALLSQAGERSPRSLPIAFDTGVACYRLGDFSRASGHFQAAAAAGDLGVRSAALYNLGNCAFRLAEKAAGRDLQGGQRLFQQAVRHYEETLALRPEAGDARDNLALARTRLAELSRPLLREARPAAAGSGAEPGGTGAGRTGKKGDDRRGGRERGDAGRGGREGEAAALGHSKRGQESALGELPRTAVRAQEARPELTRNQAEQLLSEARGREALSGAYPRQGTLRRAARPEKDW